MFTRKTYLLQKNMWIKITYPIFLFKSFSFWAEFRVRIPHSVSNLMEGFISFSFLRIYLVLHILWLLVLLQQYSTSCNMYVQALSKQLYARKACSCLLLRSRTQAWLSYELFFFSFIGGPVNYGNTSSVYGNAEIS